MIPSRVNAEQIAREYNSRILAEKWRSATRFCFIAALAVMVAALILSSRTACSTGAVFGAPPSPDRSGGPIPAAQTHVPSGSPLQAGRDMTPTPAPAELSSQLQEDRAMVADAGLIYATGIAEAGVSIPSGSGRCMSTRGFDNDAQAGEEQSSVLAAGLGYCISPPWPEVQRSGRRSPPPPESLSVGVSGESLSGGFARTQRDGTDGLVSPASAVGWARNSGRGVQVFTVTAYCPCAICCGKDARGITASGKRVAYGMVAADWRLLPQGTRLYIPGYGLCVVEDTGSAIRGNRIDVFQTSHRQAKAWGVKRLAVRVMK